MLQLHFTAQDFMRVEFASRPAPLMELGLAAATLQRRDRPAEFGHWRAERRRSLAAAAMPLFGLVPPNGRSPLFLDPLSETFEAGLDDVRAASRTFVAAELDRVCPAYRPITSWVQDLAAKDRAAWRTLEKAIRAAHQVLVGRDWDRMQASFYSDVAWRGRLLAERGLGVALTSLYPSSRWSGTTLQIDSPFDTEITLGGQGIMLMPSSVWTGQPLIGYDAAGRDVLIYPALTPLPMMADGPDGDPLVALLGRTRAAVLRSLPRGCTTSEIAADLRISLGSASQHAKTLRAAGLVVSERDGKSVLHSITADGAKLIA